MAISRSDYDGLLIVDKPAGMTSHDVVNAVRKLFHTKRVGHTGTLDPDATGVLVLCLGQATRLAEYLSAARKHYVTEARFGIETDTQDASGQITTTHDAAQLTEAEVEAVLPRFRGTILQIPPMVSALHHQGKRLYELAREGVTVEREARQIHIVSLELTAFIQAEHPLATLEVTCSTGTYIRTLVADIGAALGVGGMMQTLRRTWVGASEATAFTLSEAYTLDALRARAQAGTLGEALMPIVSALRDWPQVALSVEALARLRNGQYLALAEWKGPDRGDEEPVAVLDDAGQFCAVGRIAEGRLYPVKVLTSS
ncbi:MAG TPA: tRNA pseudouridine(55) synthase TruB [Chthonomonadaceae bacterium]|nr:tRNA pseudouridine(55) synthase TruB [Chthonomonadaceae bacterium]